MLSYKQWKSLNESFLGSVNLGVVASGQVAGIKSSFNDFALDLEEGKKGKKKMDGDGDEEVDGEIVDPAAKKDEPEEDMPTCGEPKLCGKKAKKKSKKKMDGEEGDEEEEDGGMGMKKEIPDEEEGEEEEEEEGEEEEVPEEEGKEGEEVPEGEAPETGKEELQFSKKNAKKKSKKKMQAESTEEDPDADFLSKIKKMMYFDPNQKYDDGFTKYYPQN